MTSNQMLVHKLRALKRDGRLSCDLFFSFIFASDGRRLLPLVPLFVSSLCLVLAVNIVSEGKVAFFFNCVGRVSRVQGFISF